MVHGLEAPDLLVAGKYRLKRMLGRGGMGSVWEGVHTTLGTRVAVKFIESEHLDSPEARNRFENEARAAAQLRSKHVVEVYDHGVAPDSRPFIVMEYLEGEPLDRRLERLGRLAPRDLAKILQQVSRALSKAHAAGIIHRDLKPENIFLVWDDEDAADVAKVVDFGIAKFTDQSLGATSATRTGSVLGTPYYMSPEQARGLRSVDHRADLWSLGVIAYRCIVGKLPFEGEAIGDLLVKICTTPVAVPSHVAFDVPPGFDAFIARALAREPSERFQTAQEFAESLALVCGLSGRHVPPSGELAPSTSSGPYPPARAPTPTPPSHGGTTGSPLTQTPVLVGSGRSAKGKLVAGALAAAVAIAVGVVVLAKPFGGQPSSDGAQGHAAQVPSQPVAPTVEAPPQDAPRVDPVVLPEPSAAPAFPLPPAAEAETAPVAETRKRATQRSVRPAAQRPARAPEPRGPEPRAAEVAPPPAAPPRTPTKREIDVGY